MRIIEAINKIDSLKHNTYTQTDKVAWLSSLDNLVADMMNTHEGEEVVFKGYNDETPLETELLIPDTYSEVYMRWLEAQIDYANGEYKKYNNAVVAYNAKWQEFERWYNRTHMPKGKNFKFF